MFRFVHAADLHLDSPCKGIGKTNAEVGKILRAATFEAYDNLIQLCIDKQADALLIAGDVFDGADHSLVGQIKFVELAQTNQVIFLTCHPWVVDLFKEASGKVEIVPLQEEHG